MVRVAVVGCGMWGRNIARNAATLGVLYAVCDHNLDRAAEFARDFDSIVMSFDDLLADPKIDGIIIASSAGSHENLACQGLAAGKHVYIEKPLALSLAEAENIAAAAKSADRQVMVGHLIQYHAAFIEMQAQLQAGAIGQIRHIQANRLAMGRIRNTESVLYDLCPHDLSLVLSLTGRQPETVHCTGVSHITPGVVDILTTSLSFAGNISAMLQTSWISPYKEHRLTITGTKGSLVFDDTKAWPEKLTLYQDNIQQAGDLFVIERASPIHLPVPKSEPLKAEIQAFCDVCASGEAAITHIGEALNVQNVLEQMSAQLQDLNL